MNALNEDVDRFTALTEAEGRKMAKTLVKKTVITENVVSKQKGTNLRSIPAMSIERRKLFSGIETSPLFSEEAVFSRYQIIKKKHSNMG